MALKPLSELPKSNLTIKRALLSVSDKTGILELAHALHNSGVEINSFFITSPGSDSEDMQVDSNFELEQHQ